MMVRAFNLEMKSPSDVDGLLELLDDDAFLAEDVVCILGKTEGNGGRNDFTRDLAMSALENLFAPRLGVAPEEVQDRIIFSFSGGTEGVVCPHMIVFVREGKPLQKPLSQKSLAVGIGYTRAFEPEEIGRMPQIRETARVLKEVMAEMQVTDPKDVHLVQMKGAIPNFTHEQARAASAAGKPMRSDMAYSRGASALGVALALGEVPEAALNDDVVCHDYELFSGVASCSAKPGLTRTELLVFAQSAYWDSDMIINHGILEDILDIEGILRVKQKLGWRTTIPLAKDERNCLVGVFAKSEADARGTVRGRRHTMLKDDDISDTRYSRCVLSSVIAATLGDTRVYVSTRAEHHGPQGGGPLAMIVRR